MRETRTGGRRRDLPHPRPVNKIELSAEHGRLRLILAVVFLVMGAFFIAYSVANLSSKESGWNEIEVQSSEYNCSGDFVFLYCLGEGDVSATAENKAISACYSNATEYAFQMFTNDVEYESIHNMYYINRHPNQEIEVDDILYQAFSLIQKSGNRSLYLAPVYEQYDGLFHCTEEYQAVEYDPYLNEDVADYYAAITSFANDAGMINLELRGENRIYLRVAEEYLAFALENEIGSFIDFYWMKNAFIVDYIADTMRANGFVLGSISSYDGFVRNLDDISGWEYAFNLFNRDGDFLYQAGVMRYDHAMSVVYLRDYPTNNNLDGQYYYKYQDGGIRTAYIDTADGYCKSAVGSLVSYSPNSSCAEILLQVMPVYINDYFEAERLSELVRGGVYSIYCDDSKILYNESSLVLTDLYEDNEVRYTTVYVE
ncbi:MAG: hypothetical protein K2O91_12485 [Lachnospiraceae bacterium]|nr:hypothetical protein [Lachnospiraceae bacterium]